MKGRPDTGLKFFKISESRLAFFSSGVTYARFRVLQNSPEERERLTMSVMMGSRVVRHFLSIHVGRGSRGHDELGEAPMTFATSSEETG